MPAGADVKHNMTNGRHKATVRVKVWQKNKSNKIKR